MEVVTVDGGGVSGRVDTRERPRGEGLYSQIDLFLRAMVQLCGHPLWDPTVWDPTVSATDFGAGWAPTVGSYSLGSYSLGS